MRWGWLSVVLLLGSWLGHIAHRDHCCLLRREGRRACLVIHVAIVFVSAPSQASRQFMDETLQHEQEKAAWEASKKFLDNSLAKLKLEVALLDSTPSCSNLQP